MSSIEVLKRELSALDAGGQRQVMTFLMSLADQQDLAYRRACRRKLAEKADRLPAESLTLEKTDRRAQI